MAGAIYNSWYNYIEPVRIDVSDWRYDVTQKFGMSTVAQFIGGNPIYLSAGEPLPRKLFTEIPDTVHEIHEDGIGGHKYIPTAIDFKSGSFISREFGSEFKGTYKQLAEVAYVTKKNALEDFFNSTVNDFAKHTDRLLLGSLSGYMPAINEGIDIRSKTIDTISRDTTIVKLPESRIVPLDFAVFEEQSPYFTQNGHLKKEGLTLSKLEAVYLELSKYALRGQILLFVGRSALVSLEHQRVLTSTQYANTMGLTLLKNNIGTFGNIMPTVYSYRGGAITIIGLPDEHMPDPVSTYHTMDGGELKLVGTTTGRSVNFNPKAEQNITYGYAMVSNDVSMSWGRRGNPIDEGADSWRRVSEAHGNNVGALVATGFRPRYITDEVNDLLIMRTTQEIFTARNRPETVVLVELGKNPYVDILALNIEKSLPVEVKNEAAISVEVSNDVLHVQQEQAEKQNEG